MNENKRYKEYQDEFVKLYKEGMSLRAIAKLYNINKGVVANFVRQKVDIRSKSAFPTKESAKKVYTMYLQGHSNYAIAKNLNVSYSSVITALRKHYNIITSDRRKYKHLMDDFIADYEEGLSLKEISDKYNVDKTSVYNYLIEAGVETRTYEETSRKYEINQHYFDDLNDYKAEQLGALFSIGTYCTYNVTYMIDANIHKDYKEILLFAIKDMFITDIPNLSIMNNTIKLRISNKFLYEKLMNYGLGSNINIPENFKESFIKGYLKHSLTINHKTIRIALFINSYTKYILDYLESIGLDIQSVQVRDGIHIQKEKELLKLIHKHPEIIEKINNYIQTTATNPSKWVKILNKL